MAYREVTRAEAKEVLRQWLAGTGNKRIAARVGLDVKTVRRYVNAAQALGLDREQGKAALTDELMSTLLSSLEGRPRRQRGEAWERCEAHRVLIARRLEQRLKLSKLRKLLLRQGVQVPYATLHRFAVAELGFGRTAATVPIADCAAGEELQVDTGWKGYLEPYARGKRRRFRAWIFTSVFSVTALGAPAMYYAIYYFGNAASVARQSQSLDQATSAHWRAPAAARLNSLSAARLASSRAFGEMRTLDACC